MIVHLFPKSQFTEGFVNFINNHFNSKEHIFVLYTNKPFELSTQLYLIDNVIDYDQKNLFWLIKVLKKADKIFMHNLAVNIDVLFMIYIYRKLIDKITWLIWGADLYCYRNIGKTMIDKFVERMRRTVIRRIPVIATLTDGDFTLAQEWYGVKASNIRLDYCEEHIIELLHRYKPDPQKKQRNITKILLGNSATETNRHVEALEMLKRFSDENIQIYVPLSYGDMNYAEKIEKMGKEYFGEKFIPVKEFMKPEEYYKFLSDIDVAVFNNDRQQATGNITALFYFEKKIYLREGTSMWYEWVKKQNYQIHGMGEIAAESFEEFCNSDIKEGQINFRLSEDYFSVENRIPEWEQVFGM